MKKRFAEEQIIAILNEDDVGVSVRGICRTHNISDATFYTWRKNYAGMGTDGDVTRHALLSLRKARCGCCVADAVVGTGVGAQAVRQTLKEDEVEFDQYDENAI